MVRSLPAPPSATPLLPSTQSWVDMKDEVAPANVSITFNFSGFDKPEDYVLFLPRPADREAFALREAEREESGEVVTVRWGSPTTILALLFFTPIL